MNRSSSSSSCFPLSVLYSAALPAPPGPQLNRPHWLLLAQTCRAAARLSRHACRRPPAATCRPPACLFLAWEHTSKLLLSSIPSCAPAFLLSSPLDYFARAPLSTAISHLRRFSSPILCSTSTAASHCPFLIHSSSSSNARAAQNIAPAISLSATILILVKPKFHPFSFLAKSTIRTTSPCRSSLTNFLRLPALQSPEHHRCDTLGVKIVKY
jgi:hypothetical protein